MKMSAMDWIAYVLVVVGGINWGLVGFFNYNLVDSITGGAGSMIGRVIYGLVGLSALYMIGMWMMKMNK